MKRTIMLTAVAFACHAAAQTTTMQVPQGSGVFPTIGQVECLEESGSGRYCAATYECGNGSSGELWGDMANHNGRRAIGADSPVANQLDCVVSVDGKATVRWFHGYRPTGRDGGLVGLSSVDSPEPPTIRRDVRVIGGDELWLPWFIRTRNIGDVYATMREERCGHIKEGTDQLDDCLSSTLAWELREVGRHFHWALTPLTICATELAESYREANFDPDYPYHPVGILINRSSGFSAHSVRDAMEIVARHNHDDFVPNFPPSVLDKYRECRELFQAELMDYGLADPEG